MSDEEAPPIDFNMLVLSLSTSTLMHLGELEGEDGTRSAPNLPLARQSIELLLILEEKTKGNLTGEEERLLSGVLYELRLKYAEARG